MGTRVFVWFEETTEATRVLYYYLKSYATTEARKMHLDLYTQNAGLTQKAKFWCNYVSALKGSQDLRAPDQTIYRTIHPSIVETLPDTFPELRHEFSKLESQMFDKPKRPGLTPLTPFFLMPMTVFSPLDTSTTQFIQKSTEPTEHKLKEVYCKNTSSKANMAIQNFVFLRPHFLPFFFYRKIPSKFDEYLAIYISYQHQN